MTKQLWGKIRCQHYMENYTDVTTTQPWHVAELILIVRRVCQINTRRRFVRMNGPSIHLDCKQSNLHGIIVQAIEQLLTNIIETAVLGKLKRWFRNKQ